MSQQYDQVHSSPSSNTTVHPMNKQRQSEQYMGRRRRGFPRPEGGFPRPEGGFPRPEGGFPRPEGGRLKGSKVHLDVFSSFGRGNRREEPSSQRLVESGFMARGPHGSSSGRRERQHPRGRGVRTSFTIGQPTSQDVRSSGRGRLDEINQRETPYRIHHSSHRESGSFRGGRGYRTTIIEDLPTGSQRMKENLEDTELYPVEAPKTDEGMRPMESEGRSMGKRNREGRGRGRGFGGRVIREEESVEKCGDATRRNEVERSSARVRGRGRGRIVSSEGETSTDGERFGRKQSIWEKKVNHPTTGSIPQDELPSETKTEREEMGEGRITLSDREHFQIIKRQLVDGPLRLEGEGWSVIDGYPEKGLYLAHYDEGLNFDYKRSGNMRGIIFDVKKNAIVCQSYGYTPAAITDEIKMENGIINITDTFNVDHRFEEGKFSIKVGHEGVILRAFLHDGVFYLASHRKIRPFKSRWGSSRFFLDIYKKLGGPTRDDLYHPDTRYSRFVYIFIVVDPCLLMATRQDVGEGYISYLGVMEVWSLGDNCPYTVEEMGHVEEAPRKLHTSLFSPTKTDPLHPERVIPIKTIPSMGKKPISAYRRNRDLPRDDNPLEEKWESKPIIESSELSLSQANYHLRYGYYPPYEPADKRLRQGEFLWIVSQSDNPSHDPVALRIESRAYRWRAEIRDDRFNPKGRFYEHITATFQGNEDVLESKFVRLPSFSPEHLSSYMKKNYILGLSPDTLKPSTGGSGDDEKEVPISGSSDVRGDLFPDADGAKKKPKRLEENMVADIEKKMTRGSLREENLSLVWMNFVLCMPPQQQSELADFLPDLERGLIKTAHAIEAVFEGKIFIPNTMGGSPRTRTMMIARNSGNYAAQRKLKPFNLILAALRNEGGASLYAIMRMFGRMEQLRAAATASRDKTGREEDIMKK